MRIPAAAPTLLGPQSSDSPEEAAREFEAMFWQLLLQTMRKTIPGGKGLGAGPYDRLVDIQLGRALASGGGLGIADQILADLRARGTAGASAAPGVRPAVDPLSPARDGGPAALLSPVAGPARISSGYGARIDPLDGKKAFHHGVDIAAAAGTRVRAAAAGTVQVAGWLKGLGNTVTVRDASGWTQRYGHLGSLTVRPGDEIAAGEALGTVGSTGRSTGPHLHFELRFNGHSVDPLTHGLRRSSIE